jgi:hypothetical protein
VMELAHETDESFAKARTFGRSIGANDDAAKEEFARHFQHIPTPGIAARDYASFSVAQRELVQRVLLAGRFSIALVGRLFDRDVLFTHAGISRRELDHLALETVSERTIANALEARFAEAIAKVRPAWEKGERAELDLSPLHAPGRSKTEGGGLLYHRPAHRIAAKSSWDFDASRPRRFDPLHLPRGVVQACGHSSHKRCVKDLGASCTDAAKAAAHASLRTLEVEGDHVTYDVGLLAPRPNTATLYMLDPALAHSPCDEIELLTLDLL